MKIAVENPSWTMLCEDPTFMFYGYEVYFIEKYVDYLYVTNNELIMKYEKVLKEKNLNGKVKIINNISDLNLYADILIGFHIPLKGKTYEVEKFHGLKIYCVDDYFYKSEYKRDYLNKTNVDEIYAFGQLDRDSGFFRSMFPKYINKVISIPFGYAPRYKSIKPFEQRKNKAVGLGSINMVNDKMCEEDDMIPVVKYFHDHTWTHETRKYIQDNAENLYDCIDSFFPDPEKQKDFGYDAVERLNDYKIFVNDAGIYNFAAIRTYEGIACGCVMVAEGNEIYRDLGFIDDYNYISFEKGNYEQMVSKIKYYLKNENELNKLSERSLQLSLKYTQEHAADIFFEKLKNWEVKL